MRKAYVVKTHFIEHYWVNFPFKRISWREVFAGIYVWEGVKKILVLELGSLISFQRFIFWMFCVVWDSRQNWLSFLAMELCILGIGFISHFWVHRLPRVIKCSRKCFSHRTELVVALQSLRFNKHFLFNK